MTSLQVRTDIIIKPADKGSATVVMSKEAYMTEAYRQLTNQQYYCKLEEDPSEDHANKIKDLVQEMYQNGHLDKDTFKYLTPKNPKIARFYHQPKYTNQLSQFQEDLLCHPVEPPLNVSQNTWTSIFNLL